MEADEDDDIYAPEEPTVTAESKSAALSPSVARADARADDLEEGEEEDEGAEMDEDDDDSVCRWPEREASMLG